MKKLYFLATLSVACSIGSMVYSLPPEKPNGLKDVSKASTLDNSGTFESDALRCSILNSLIFHRVEEEEEMRFANAIDGERRYVEGREEDYRKRISRNFKIEMKAQEINKVLRSMNGRDDAEMLGNDIDWCLVNRDVKYPVVVARQYSDSFEYEYL